MSLASRTTGGGTGRGGLWPVLLALLVVLLPTACVLWFLNEAVRNERLALRQKLVDAYRGHLSLVRQRLDTYWHEQAAALDKTAGKSPGAAAFAACVAAGWADGVVCYDDAGRPTYPATTPPPAEPLPDDPAWSEADGREHTRNDPAGAAAAYQAIAAKTSSAALAARALQAAARCLVHAGHAPEALRVLGELAQQAKYADARDPAGRLIAADAELRVLELLGDPSKPGFAEAADRLSRRVMDYGPPPLAAAQRRFLMKELCRLSGDTKPPSAELRRALAAEDLAAAYLDAHPPAADDRLRGAGLADVWRLAAPSGRVVALLRGESVMRQTAAILAADPLPGEVRVALVPPDTEPDGEAAHLLPAGATMPGWRLAILENTTADAGSSQRVAANVWIAILAIAAMTIVALLVAALVGRQMRIARLKNDLLATVSHELKTPLASMRLLVDTLLDAESLDVAQTRDYLRLMAKENARLSRLIDNFLSFSRMERGKQQFDFAAAAPAEIVRRAVEAAGERFAAPGCRLEVQTDDNVPPVRADADAMVTAVLNLLDNAYKYTGDEKRVVLHTFAADGQVSFAVSDNGIGLAPRAAHKVFRPFYQADRRLARTAGGCGLGLSIVRYIVTAHGGTVRVASRPGEGSTFTVSIPSVKS